jgi:hypothetical protein
MATAGERSQLLPSTLALLRKVTGATQPLFTNQILAELFEMKHTHGPIKVLPRTDGKFVVMDSRRPVGKQDVATADRVDQADVIAKKLAGAP